MNFTDCINTGFFLRMGMIGPSGSGKTYTALAVATALGFERIGVIDTENRSARRYAKSFDRGFLSLELDRFSPKDYIEAIRVAEAAGIEVLIIDSLSHAWMGKGGVLEMVDQSAKRQSRGQGSGSSFNGWREVTPEHNKLVDALIHAKLHLIVTMRVKTEYVVEQVGGKSVPRKVGLAPVQRDGLEYEFDIIGDVSPEHDLAITKSRCPALSDSVINRPGADLAHILRGWLDGVEAEPEKPAAAAPRVLPRSAEQPPYAEPDSKAEMATIVPWLKRIDEASRGTEEQLDAVRSEMNATLTKRTKMQGEALRRAIETARAAIHSQAERTPAPVRTEEGEADPAELAQAEGFERSERVGLGNYDA